MVKMDPIGIAGAYGMGAAATGYVQPGDMVMTWGPILMATLLGAAINVLWQIKKGGDKIDAAIAGLLAVMLGLFMANIFGDILQEYFPVLPDASATALAGLSSTFGVSYALRVLERIGRDKED